MSELVENRVKSALEKNDISLPSNQVDVMIIGHGSKDPNAQLSIQYVVDNLTNTYRNISHCFLEIEEPNIQQGIDKCQKNNPEVLVIVFYFLHKGAHVKRDIYEDLNPAIDKSNLKKVLITEHIGTDEKMIDLILERAREVEHAN
jgi:sirohydrochlorin ferrochelatase